MLIASKKGQEEAQYRTREEKGVILSIIGTCMIWPLGEKLIKLNHLSITEIMQIGLNWLNLKGSDGHSIIVEHFLKWINLSQFHT